MAKSYFKNLAEMFSDLDYTIYRPAPGAACSCGQEARAVVKIDDIPVIFCGPCALDFLIKRSVIVDFPMEYQ